MVWVSFQPTFYSGAVIDLSKRVRKGRTECGLGLIVKESKKGEN